MRQPPAAVNPLRISQIIVAALVLGVLTFGLMTVLIGGQGKPNNEALPLMGLGIAGCVIAARVVVPGLIVAGRRTSIAMITDEVEQREALETLYLTRTIIGNALLEGAAFMNLVAYLIALQWYSLAVVGALLAIMLITFPTRGQFDAWMQQQRELLDLEHN